MDIVPFSSMLVLAFAMGATFRHKVAVEDKVDEALFPGGGLKNDIAARASVSSIRAAFRDKCFTTEATAAIAAVTALDMNSGFINKHLGFLWL